MIKDIAAMLERQEREIRHIMTDPPEANIQQVIQTSRLATLKRIHP